MNRILKIFFLVLIPSFALFPNEKEGLHEDCKTLMQAQEYLKAQEIAKDYIKKFPQDVNGYICQDAACNSAGQCSNTNQNRALVLEVWKKYNKPNLVKKGAPLGIIHWPRKTIETQNWYIVAAEYYEPIQFPGDSVATSFLFRYMIRKKGGNTKERIFELEHMKGQFESYTLVEATKKTFIPIKEYDDHKPDIFEVQNDLAKYLEGKP